MYKFASIKQKEEIKIITALAYRFLKDDGTIYVLDAKSLKVAETVNAYYNKKYDPIKKKILEHLASPQYRAEMRITYKQLSIFSPFLQMIDSAIISFFEENYLSAYYTLVPIIEGLLLRWSKLQAFKLGTHKINNCEIREGSHLYKFVIEKTQKIFQSGKDDWWRIYNLILLRKVIKIFFRPQKYCPEGYSLNRNISLHLLDNPDYFECRQNTIKLFNFIDLIAIINKYEYCFEAGIIALGKNYSVCTYKYFADELNEIEKYKIFYKDCGTNCNINKLKKLQAGFQQKKR